jgi:hypothetical protein
MAAQLEKYKNETQLEEREDPQGSKPGRKPVA